METLYRRTNLEIKLNRINYSSMESDLRCDPLGTYVCQEQFEALKWFFYCYQEAQSIWEYIKEFFLYMVGCNIPALEQPGQLAILSSGLILVAHPTSSWNLLSYLTDHLGRGIRPYLCPFCGEGLVSSSSLLKRIDFVLDFFCSTTPAGTGCSSGWAAVWVATVPVGLFFSSFP